jgi:hypothetical protein
MTPNIQISVCLTPELRLEQALKDAGIENPASVVKLIVSGTLTEDDFEYIRENMAETLQEFDMGAASVENNKIPDFAFSECVGLTFVIIPETVEKIGEFAFNGCSGLTSFTISDSISEIGFLAFEGCTGLTSIRVHPRNPAYASENGVLFNKDKTELIFCIKSQQGAYIIPDSVIEIDTRAFAYCADLTSIIIPASVTTIEFCAFGGCVGLTSIVIPDSVNKIGGFAFVNCADLTYVVIPKSVIEIGKNVFAGCHNLTTVVVHPDNPIYESVNGKLTKKV